MNGEITEAEYLHFESVLAEFQAFCRVIFEAVNEFDLPETASQFRPDGPYSKRRIWNIARAAWLEFRDEDPDHLHLQCADYLASSRNADPCLADKASRND